MKPPKGHKNSIWMAGLASVLAIFSSGTSSVAGTPVADTTAWARLAEQIQLQSNQLTQLTDIQSLTDEQLRVLGDFGVMGDLFGSSSMSSIGAQAEFYENMKKFAFDPCSINLCQVGDNPVGTTDIEEAMTWAKQNFYASEQLDNATSRDLNEVRRRAVVYATTNGLALANVVHNELAGAGDEADALEQIVDASQTLRGDVRANSAIALATYKIEIQKLALLTAMLNIESTAGMMQTSIYHEEGGTEFPDAFIDNDFTNGDFMTRTSVTMPEKNEGGN